MIEQEGVMYRAFAYEIRLFPSLPKSKETIPDKYVT